MVKQKLVIIRGSDTSAFGNKFMRIKVNNTTGKRIKKAEWHCGKLIKDLGEYPEFPILLELTREETIQLQNKNVCYLYCYDEDDKLYICPNKGYFRTLPEKF